MSASRPAPIEAMIASACLGAASDHELAEGLRGFLESHGVEREDIDALCASPPRLALYRKLVRNNLADVVDKMMPRARARLNRRGRVFDAWFERFLAEAAPKTHYLRDVPREFLEWVTPQWQERAHADVPAYLADLAAYELVEFTIAAVPIAREPADVDEVAIDRPLVFTHAKRLVRYAFAVHELPEAKDDETVPAARDVSLLVYRDAEHKVRFLELSALAAAILAELFAAKALGEAVEAACRAGGVSVDDTILADTARLLADLGDRGVLLGAVRR